MARRLEEVSMLLVSAAFAFLLLLSASCSGWALSSPAAHFVSSSDASSATQMRALLQKGYRASLFPGGQLTLSNGRHEVVFKQDFESSGEVNFRDAESSQRLVDRYYSEMLEGSDDWCEHQQHFDFIPENKAVLRPGQSAQFTSGCFAENTVHLDLDAKQGGILSFKSSSSKSMFCSDSYLIVTRKMFFFLNKFFKGESSVILPRMDPEEMQYVERRGLTVTRLPCGMLGTVPNLLKTISIFSSLSWDMLLANNDEFLSHKVGWQLKPVGLDLTKQLNESVIRSGDYLACMRHDGVDPLIAFGTGSHTGHSAVALRDANGALFVLESTDKNPFFTPGYVDWPEPYGIIKTPFAEWMEKARKARFHVSILPISDRASAKFDAARAWRFFESVQGLPYGYSVFLYTFFDTASPQRNLPAPLSDEAVWFALTAFDQIVKMLPDQVKKLLGSLNPQTMIVQGVNNRLKSDCSDMACINKQLDERNMTLTEAVAMPELDEYDYDGHQSYVCSNLAFKVYQEALADSDLMPADILAKEQVPRDNYQMALWQSDRFNEDNCPGGGLVETERGTYCQVLGDYRMELPGYNSIELYTGMNNRCPSQWPTYERTEHC